jgi:hypothetical protein
MALRLWRLHLCRSGFLGGDSESAFGSSLHPLHSAKLSDKAEKIRKMLNFNI